MKISQNIKNNKRKLINYSKAVYKHGFLFILVINFSGSVFSQVHADKAPELKTSGLLNEVVFRNIFTGNFGALDFNREQPEFSFLFDGYITAYFINCGNNLPDDKVEIIYNDKHTGVFTTPAMFKAEATLSALKKGVDPSETAMSTIQNNNPLGSVGDYLLQPRVVKQDMKQLFSINECNSAGIKRFEQNLYAFAMFKLPIILEGSNIPRPDPNVLLRDQVFNKLIDDLIKAQSANWKINQYVPNSVTKEKIVSKDNEGRPASVIANYRYMLGRQDIDGSVTLTFIEGLPNCLYFNDEATRCRTPSWKIVLNYATGKYVNADTLYKVPTSSYTVDKKDSNWVVKFKHYAIGLLNYPNTEYEQFNKDSGTELIVKPGQWAQFAISSNDRQHTAHFNVDHRPKPVPGPDGKIPDYSIDKTTSTNYWIVRFYNNWQVRILPGYRSIDGEIFDFSITLEPGQYVEKRNSDDTYTLLKDLDRR